MFLMLNCGYVFIPQECGLGPHHVSLSLLKIAYVFSLTGMIVEIGPSHSTSTCQNADEGGHVCVSQGGRFPKFSLEGKPPRASVKGPDDLTLCRIYRKKTCCSSVQTHPALVALRKLASNGEGSKECVMHWEAMECSLCDPVVGTQRGPPALCKSFCDSSLEACRNSFFSFDSMTQVLTPCSPKDVICARATEWAANGSHFCELAGFVVPSLRNAMKPFCFDGKPALTADVSANKKPGRTKTYRKQRSIRAMLRYLFSMVSGDVIVWAIGGLVLTAGAILMRRRSLNSEQRKAALLRLVQEARSKQQSKSQPLGKKVGKRA
ncbi:hypothetical protein GOP47_0017499 [Adiantum capillus-veneris]|uniref:Folate receptor-like domain-containing protein n=1 Tax=Adiantum capillus-veneris TaxID=13818 RepID=A0A9D4ZBU3_ADICA|nr:hypothetical protein GOP47_0017499 [Adiantum capillus-veneris]